MRMLQRPLIVPLLALLGGILLGHSALPEDAACLFFLSLFIASLLLSSLFLPSRIRPFCHVLVFFLLGVLLDGHEHRPSYLIPLADERQEVLIQGTVLEPPLVEKDSYRLVLRVQRFSHQGISRGCNEKVRITVYDAPRDFSPGDGVLLPVRLSPFRNFRNPGCYDYASSMRLRGFSCAASLSDGRRIVPTAEGRLGLVGEMVEKVRRPVRECFRQGLTPQNQALFQALILGEQQGIGPDLREPFNRTGLGHVLAVSGLNIGLVAWLFYGICKAVFAFSYKLSLGHDIRKLAALVTCLPVVAYTGLAGFEVSSMRAMIMILTYLISVLLGREKEVWSTLGLSALLVLSLDPHSLFSITFQLSFLGVFGLLWLVPSMQGWIRLPGSQEGDRRRLDHAFYSYFWGLLVVTLSATLFLLPLVVSYFHRISLVTVPANVAVVPVMGLIIIPIGLMVIAILPFSASLAGLVLELDAWALDRVMDIIRYWSGVEWAEMWFFTPNILEFVCFYGLLFFLFFIRRGAWARIGLLLTSLVLLCDVAYWVFDTRFGRDLRVTFLDVGQGHAAVVQFPGNRRMLIDGGGFPRSGFDVGKMVVAPFLLHSKILKVDCLVLSHPQADHMDGLRFVASHFGPKEFWYNGDRAETPSFRELMGIVESSQMGILLPEGLRGGKEIGGVMVEVLHPLPGPVKGLKANDNSLVLRLTYGGTSCLFAGDLEKAGEEALVAGAGPRLRSDILLVPHHGSRASCTGPFLEAVRPRISIISSGGGRTFFPHQETIERLKEAGSTVLRTDQSGAIEVSINKEGFRVRTPSPPASGRFSMSYDLD